MSQAEGFAARDRTIWQRADRHGFATAAAASVWICNGDRIGSGYADHDAIGGRARVPQIGRTGRRNAAKIRRLSGTNDRTAGDGTIGQRVYGHGLATNAATTV